MYRLKMTADASGETGSDDHIMPSKTLEWRFGTRTSISHTRLSIGITSYSSVLNLRTDMVGLIRGRYRTKAA